MNPRPKSDLVRQSLWVSPTTLAELKKIGLQQDRPVGYLLRKAAEEFVERCVLLERKAVPTRKAISEGRYFRGQKQQEQESK